MSKTDYASLCGGCAFWCPTVGLEEDGSWPVSKGYCRRYPEYVKRMPDDWCYEWEPSEDRQRKGDVGVLGSPVPPSQPED